jgi:hypothetical protein
VLALTIFAARVLLRGDALPEHEVRNRPAELSDDGYVSSRKCQSCHPGEYALKAFLTG